MKKYTIFLLCILLLISVNINAQSKRTSDSKGLLFTVGGGLGLDLPVVDIVLDGYLNRYKGIQKTNTFVAFGFNVITNATLTYKLSNNWAIGGAVTFGYNFMGGPHALYDVAFKQEHYTNTYSGFGKLYHSLVADLNFCARSPTKKGGDLILEGGATLMPTWASFVCNTDGTVKIGEDAKSTSEYTFNGNTENFSYSGREAAMMAGPNVFVGIDYFVTKNLNLIFGARLRTAFGCANVYYINHGYSDQTYLNSIVQLAFEVKINYYHEF